MLYLVVGGGWYQVGRHGECRHWAGEVIIARYDGRLSEHSATLLAAFT